MKATYHQEAPNKPLVLDVIGKNEDGTVNLGYGDAKAHDLVVGSVKVTTEPTNGCCVLQDAKVEKAEPPADDKKTDGKKKK